MKNANSITKAAATLLAAALAACCVPAAAVGAEQAQDGVAAAEAPDYQAISDSFDSNVGLSSQSWSDVPSIAAAWDGLHGNGKTPSSLASFRTLFQSICAFGVQSLTPYGNGAPVLLENGLCYRVSDEALAEAMAALDGAKEATGENTATAYYIQSSAVITAVNAALCSATPAPDADALKLIWDNRALAQVADETGRAVALPKGSKVTAKARSVSIAAPLSQSGASAAFAKSGGSPKVAVSEDGVCTLKKGTRKGTYTARVQVSYSSNTLKLTTVTFEVE